MVFPDLIATLSFGTVTWRPSDELLSGPNTAELKVAWKYQQEEKSRWPREQNGEGGAFLVGSKYETTVDSFAGKLL